MNETEETGPVSVALTHGWTLLNGKPELAREILKVRRATGRLGCLKRPPFVSWDASARCSALERGGKLWPRATFELGLLRYRGGRLDEALSLMGSALRNALKLPNVWRGWAISPRWRTMQRPPMPPTIGMSRTQPVIRPCSKWRWRWWMAALPLPSMACVTT